MAGMDKYLDQTSYTGDSSEGGGEKMSIDDQGESFYGRVTSNQDKKYGDHDASKEARKKDAAKGLMGGEESALGGNGSGVTGDGTEGARSGENNIASGTASENATSGFTNKVSGVSGGKAKASGGFKGMMKKGLPLMVVVGGVIGFGLISYIGQLAMPFSLISQFQGNFDSIGTSNFARSVFLTRAALHSAKRYFKYDDTEKFIKKHGKLYQKITDSPEKYFSMTKRQAAKLSKAIKGKDYRLSVVDDASAGGKKIVYHTANGEDIDVYADPDLAAQKGGRYIGELYEEDADFRHAYHQGTRTWRQSIYDWYDGLCNKFISRLKIVRNRFRSFKAKNNTGETEPDLEAAMKSAVGNGDIEGETGGESTGNKTQLITPPEGDPYEEIVDGYEGGKGKGVLSLKKLAGYKSAAESVQTFLNGMSAKYNRFKKAFATASKIYCIAVEMLNALNLLMIANEIKEVLQFAQTLFEGVQKAQVEDSDTTPLSNITNDMTIKRESTYYLPNTGSILQEPEKVTDYGSFMEADPITSMYGNTRIDTEDLSVKSFNINTTLKNSLGLIDTIRSIGTTITTSVQAYATCLISKVMAAAADIVSDLIDLFEWGAGLAACIFGIASGAGVVGCGDLAKKLVWLVATTYAFEEIFKQIVSAVTQYVIPWIAGWMQRDLTSKIGGLDAGTASFSGGHIDMAKNHQSGGGSVASESTYSVYLQKKEEYIADIARYERETRSPFDATSPYTFLGNVLTRSVPILVGNNSIIEGVKNVAAVTSNALTSLMPGASAITATVTMEEAAKQTAELCPELASIGAVGDPFCNPFIITDYELIEEDPADIVYKVSELGNGTNFTNDEGDIPTINTKINNTDKSSRLMEYIVFCGERDSPFGMADLNLAKAITGEQSYLDTHAPIWGGIVDINTSTDVLAKIGYVTGESCVAKPDDTSHKADVLGSRAFTWSEAKYYQRFIEDQRYMESTGLVEKNAVTVALEKYHEDHPLDNSEEGVLARLSGMTKEQVIATQDFIEVALWMNNYNPDGYYPYGYEKPEEAKIVINDYEPIELEHYDLISDNSWMYYNRQEYYIS